MAEYTPQELSRLQLGYLIRERDGATQRGAGGRRQELRAGHRDARQEMLTDLGMDASAAV